MIKKIPLLIILAGFSSAYAADYNMRVAANGVQPPIYGSCKEILEKKEDSVSGTYTIKNNLKKIPVYCDMVSDGGGWTFILGPGTEYAKNHSFWNGVNPGDGKTTSFNGFSISTENSAHLIKNFTFKEMKFSEASSSENFSSNNQSSFSTKKANKTPFQGLIWDYVTPAGGYTTASFLIAKKGLRYYNGDYYNNNGLGLSGGASSGSSGTGAGTWHYRFSGIVDCGNPQGCFYSNSYTSSASIGTSNHRFIKGNTITGLFFR